VQPLVHPHQEEVRMVVDMEEEVVVVVVVRLVRRHLVLPWWVEGVPSFRRQQLQLHR